MTFKNVLLFCLLTVCFSFKLNAQLPGQSKFLEPVKWDSSVEKISDTEFVLSFKAAIDKGWYIYSQTRQEEDGLAPETYFEFKDLEDNYKLEGKTSEPEIAPIFDPIFEENVKKFKDYAVFKQKISLLNSDLSQIQVFVEYQTCDNAKCIPGDFTFYFSLDGSAIVKEVVEIDDKSKRLTSSLDLNVTGWDKYEKQNVEEQSR